MYNLSPQTPSSSSYSSTQSSSSFVDHRHSDPKLASRETSHRHRAIDRPMMQHSPTMSSAAAMAKANKRGVVVSSLQGPRPLPLSLPGTTSSSSLTSPPRPAKRPRVAAVNGDEAAAAGPVIVYEHTPKVIHARPDEFKALVQRLTGRIRTGTAGGGGGDQEAVQTAAQPVLSSQQDPLVLALGQQHVPALPLVGDHHHTPPVLLPPSPGGNFLVSPSSFLFSPATMQAIQELIS